ncbi:hypothetical protein ARSEF4850_007374 [Beauveria asiatica]
MAAASSTRRQEHRSSIAGLDIWAGGVDDAFSSNIEGTSTYRLVDSIAPVLTRYPGETCTWQRAEGADNGTRDAGQDVAKGIACVNDSVEPERISDHEHHRPLAKYIGLVGAPDHRGLVMIAPAILPGPPHNAGDSRGRRDHIAQPLHAYTRVYTDKSEANPASSTFAPEIGGRRSFRCLTTSLWCGMRVVLLSLSLYMTITQAGGDFEFGTRAAGNPA